MGLHEARLDAGGLAAMDAVAYRQPLLAAGGENPVTLPGDASIHRQTPAPRMTMGGWHHGKAVTVQSSVRMAADKKFLSQNCLAIAQEDTPFCLRRSQIAGDLHHRLGHAAVRLERIGGGEVQDGQILLSPHKESSEERREGQESCSTGKTRGRREE